MKNVSQQVAKLLLQLKAVTLNPKKPFKYSSGMLSPVYTDCRILISHPNARKTVRDLYIQAIKAAGDFDIIAGTSTAGIPHAAWISDKLKLPMIYVRGKAKDHGKGNQIEGVLGKNQQAAVIEDLISTGESSVETARAIRAAGGKVSHIFSIMTYGMDKSTQNFKDNKVKLISLTNFEDLTKAAEELKFINKDEMQTVLDWASDPTSWGKKMGFE